MNANNFKGKEGTDESSFLFVREERLRLECESRVSVNKWAREGWKVKHLRTAEYMYEYMYFYTCKESSLLDHNLPDS